LRRTTKNNVKKLWGCQRTALTTPQKTSIIKARKLNAKHGGTHYAPLVPTSFFGFSLLTIVPVVSLHAEHPR
jgi:hypothetical protein